MLLLLLLLLLFLWLQWQTNIAIADDCWVITIIMNHPPLDKIPTCYSVKLMFHRKPGYSSHAPPLKLFVQNSTRRVTSGDRAKVQVMERIVEKYLVPCSAFRETIKSPRLVWPVNRNPTYCWWKKSCTAKLVLDLFHQQYYKYIQIGIIWLEDPSPISYRWWVN